MLPVVALFRRQTPVTASIDDRPVVCLVCAAEEFWMREIKLNTSGMELLDLGWANESATGLVCTNCGYVHEFVGDRIEIWRER